MKFAYKRLKFGHFYINKDNTFICQLLEGNRKEGYNCIGKSINFWVGVFYIKSRIIPNDDSWKEIKCDTIYDEKLLNS